LNERDPVISVLFLYSQVFKCQLFHRSSFCLFSLTIILIIEQTDKDF
jgi:hypothetical protein